MIEKIKKLLTKNQLIVIPILNNEYKVVVCWGNEKYLQKVAKKWGYDRIYLNDGKKEYRGNTFTNIKKRLYPIIVLPRCPQTDEEIGTLAHEAIHAVLSIWELIGETEIYEVFAHSVGAIVRLILRDGKR